VIRDGLALAVVLAAEAGPPAEVARREVRPTRQQVICADLRGLSPAPQGVDSPVLFPTRAAPDGSHQACSPFASSLNRNAAPVLQRPEVNASPR
jgi:hypothetical protein